MRFMQRIVSPRGMVFQRGIAFSQAETQDRAALA
jgi:hypothetical protein